MARSGVWATHGHYLDRHLLPVSAYGVFRGALGRAPGAHATPADYEYAGGPSLSLLESRIMRALPRPPAALLDDLVEFVRAATMPGAPRARRLSWLAVRVLGVQMRRASIPALGRVIAAWASRPSTSSSATCTGSGHCPATSPSSGAAPAGGPRSPTPAPGSTSPRSYTG